MEDVQGALLAVDSVEDLPTAILPKITVEAESGSKHSLFHGKSRVFKLLYFRYVQE